MIEVREHYGAEPPPRWVRQTVERLLRWLPFEYSNGVSAVVLANGDTSLSGRRRRKRSERKGVVLGTYYGRTAQGAAWIELNIDHILSGLPPRPFDRLRVFRDEAIGRVLFHEIGHHVSATNRAIGRTPESSADAWANRLMRGYFRKTYGYLRPFRPVFKVIARIARRIARIKRNSNQ